MHAHTRAQTHVRVVEEKEENSTQIRWSQQKYFQEKKIQTLLIFN